MSFIINKKRSSVGALDLRKFKQPSLHKQLRICGRLPHTLGSDPFPSLHAFHILQRRPYKFLHIPRINERHGRRLYSLGLQRQSIRLNIAGRAVCILQASLYLPHLGIRWRIYYMLLHKPNRPRYNF